MGNCIVDKFSKNYSHFDRGWGRVEIIDELITLGLPSL